LRRFAITSGIYLGTFLAGGIFAFAYSYHPLHNAKNWKIAYLEERMVAKTHRLDEALQELEKLRTEALGRPDFESFEKVQDELAKANKTIASLEKKVTWSDDKLRELERSRASWQSRATQAEAKAKKLADAANAAPVVASLPAPSEGTGAAAAISSSFDPRAASDRPGVPRAQSEPLPAAPDSAGGAPNAN
jgi:septal ring factor EnvC (AmiA/AmiB activator)